MGRSIDILEIGPNDDLFEVIRKCNYNFRSYNGTQYGDDGSITQLQDDVEDVREDLAKQVQNIINMINELGDNLANNFSEELRKIKSEITQMKNDIKQMKKDLIPPIGTYMWCTYDPNTKYPGTTWVKQTEGYVLISAGSTYTSQSKYGSKNKTVPVPYHSHEIMSGYNLYLFMKQDGDGDNGVGSISQVALGTSGNYVWSHSHSQGEVNGSSLFTSTGASTRSTGSLSPTIDVTQPSIACPLWKRTA